jgi:hypothetical protein
MSTSRTPDTKLPAFTDRRRVRQTTLLVFVSVFTLYLSLAPCGLSGRGYNDEELSSGMSVLALAEAWIKGLPLPAFQSSRHGLLPVLFDLPFIKFGTLTVNGDFGLAFEPLFLTAGLVTVLFLWLRKLCSPAMSLLLALSGAFGTMLWPYAYISLETKQSFFVLLAGYLALANGKLLDWPRVLLFATACGMALSMKSTGIILGPVFVYLIFQQFWRDWRERWPQLLAVLLTCSAFLTVGAVSREWHWTNQGGSLNVLRPWLIDSPFQIFFNVLGLFGSPTKGLFVFAPILLATIYAIPRAFRANRQIATFGVLVTVCTLAFLAILRFPSDEVWGPRYMHVTIAPLLLSVGVAWPRFQWKRFLPLAMLTAVGVAVSFLGAFSYYVTKIGLTEMWQQNTMEWITGDNVWNEVMLNERLFKIWVLQPPAPALWAPDHLWVWAPPAGTPVLQPIDLRVHSAPQSFMLVFWNRPKDGFVLRIFQMCLIASGVGILSFVWVVAKIVREQKDSG